MKVRGFYRSNVALIGSWMLVVSWGCSREANESALVNPKASIPVSPVERQKDAPALLAETRQSLQEGNPAAAGKAIRSAVSIDAVNPELRFTLAIVLGQEHRYAEAVMMLDELAKSVPETRLPALGQTAEWLVLQGEWQKAEVRYKEVLAEVPDAAMAHRQLAQLLICQGRRLEAAKHLNALCQQGNIEEIELRTLLSLASPFVADLVRADLEPVGPLGKARFAISRGEWDAAITILLNQKTLAAAESALLARIHAEQRDFAKLESWEAASQQSSETADDAFARGVLAAHQGAHDVAVKRFCESVLYDQTDKRAYEALAESLDHLAVDDAAAKATQRAQWLARTHEIGREMAENDQRDLNQLSELAQLLDQLHRPFESLSWQAVRLAYGRSTLPEIERQAELTEINRKRLQLLNRSEPNSTAQFILCGIDPNSINGGK